MGNIRTVCNQMVILEAVGQVGCLSDVVALSRGEPKAQRIAQRIDADMNFGGKPTPTAPQGLVGLSTSSVGRSRGAGMSTHNRAIKDQVLQIWLDGNIGQHLFPNTLFIPAGKTLVDAIP